MLKINRILIQVTGLFWVIVLFWLFILATHSIAASESKKTPLSDRATEPIVMTGAEFPFLKQPPTTQVFAYVYRNAVITGPITLQIDEVDATGAYTIIEDSVLDTNDELVLVAGDLGDQLPDVNLLTQTLPISDSFYEVMVTEPVSNTEMGWVYLVRSNQIAQPTAESSVIVSGLTFGSDKYRMRLSSSILGLDRLFLNDSPLNLIDRFKIRIQMSNVPIFGDLTLTEENLGDAPQIEIIKTGPIRAIVLQTVGQEMTNGIPYQFTLKMTYLGYETLIQTSTALNFDIPDQINIESIRISTDFTSTITLSPTTYYNANIPQGVMIDGQPDAVPALPLSHWLQLSRPEGRLVQAFQPLQVNGSQKNYYRDDATPESAETATGQPGSYGEIGLLLEGNLTQQPAIESTFYILPAATGSDNVGDQYATYYANPFVVSVKAYPEPLTLFLPLVAK